MKKLLFPLFVFSCLLVFSVKAQNTVGLISYKSFKAFDGYNLIYPHNQPTVYLINNCGEIVHSWEDDTNWRPANTAYLTNDGLLYKSKRDATVTGDAIWAGGGGAMLEIRDWDNNLVWDFEMNDSIYRLHHDFSVMPNGNIIALAWELKTEEECIEAGRDPDNMSQGKVWPDWVFEIDPNTDEIVWEWHAWDHLVQDFDETKSNYGIVQDHKELIDINGGRADGHPDWMHGNALDYNAESDQIMLSMPYFNEIWIIDHTTTTEQASTHNGGFSGVGGDLMYRWGNPESYDQGDSTDQQLFFQHDAHWIDDYIPVFNPSFGKIAVFNNRVGADFSTANFLDPSWDMYDWKYTELNDEFLPETYDNTFMHPIPQNMYSTGLSSIQLLPNGNTLLTSGRFGYTFELTPDNEIVWEYITPFMGQTPATQGDTLEINNNLTFRVKRLPADLEVFVDKDLSPKGWIELDPNTTYCDSLTSITEIMNESAFKIYPNPSNEYLVVEWDGMKYVELNISNLEGKMLQSHICNGGRTYLDISDLEAGIYFLSFFENERWYSRKLIIQH